jgi:hypothetical protein
MIRPAHLLAMSMTALAALPPCAPSEAAELLMFEQPACPFCAAFNREIAPDYPRSQAGGIAPLRHVDIYQSRTGGIDGLDPAVFTPTFVQVDKGREVGRMMGYPGRRFFYSEIQALLDRLPRRLRRPADRRRAGAVFSWRVPRRRSRRSS